MILVFDTINDKYITPGIFIGYAIGKSDFLPIKARSFLSFFPVKQELCYD